MNKDMILLSSSSTTMVLHIDKNVNLCYFGSTLKDEKDYLIYNIDKKNELFSTFGKGEYFTPSILISNNDQTFNNDFTFDHYEYKDNKSIELPYTYNKKESLSLYYIDKRNELSLIITISTFNDCNAFTFSTSLKNNSTKDIEIRKLSSLALNIEGKEATIYSFDGTWANERNINKTELKGGTFINSSLTGSSSAFHNPFNIIKINNSYYGTNILYSGNHKTSIEVDPFGTIHIENGINDFMFSYLLKPNETFYAPESTLVLENNIDEITLSYHSLINNHILKRKDVLSKRVLFNSWEGVYFSFNKEKIIEMAKASKELGAELFVLDDGWFGERNDDSTSLGDWYPNKDKIGSLKKLGETIRSLGIEFGIWMEPEMISPKSELYKKHPEYAMVIPNIAPVLQRNQLMLDITNIKVMNYIINSISKVLDESKATYLKWDYNRNMTDIYSKKYSSFEYSYRYTLSLYKIMSTLVKKYPNVLFEGCASGGARYDLGILSYFPQIWCSDNTDPKKRMLIQTGTSICYPINTMCSHIAKDLNNNTHLTSLLSDRYNIALMGNLGYELNPLDLTSKQKEEIKKEIADYKLYRDFTFNSDFYLLEDIFNTNLGGYIYINKNKDTALCSLFIKDIEKGFIRLKGLNKDYIYLIDNKKYTGEYLLNIGIEIKQDINTFKNINTDKITTKLLNIIKK